MTQAADVVCDNTISGVRLTVVYVDVLLFINTVITYAVLITTEKLMKRETKTVRLIAASFIGSLFSLLIFLDVNGFWFSLLIKAVSSLLITLISFPFINRKEYSKTTLMTVGVSLVYSGAFILIYQLFKPPNMLIINDIPYFEFNPLVLLGSTAIIYIGVTVFQKLFCERIKRTIVRLTFTVDGNHYKCMAKIDTGCSLTEPFSGSPVIIVDPEIFQIGASLQKRVIPYSTVAHSSMMYAVKADRIMIDDSYIDKTVYIAVNTIGDRDIQAVINSEIVR